MSDIAIRVENLSKRYQLGTDSSGIHRFSELLYGLGRHAWQLPRRWLSHAQQAAESTAASEHWALRDVSFDVKEGEVVGIIGRNGAGKSTLLKILSRITEPTSGRFGVKGRVASLLEVGTGFHPELTGRENIYLSGTLLGMTRAEIKRHFNEIVAFAEIDQFLDTPVKRYSSGMYVRLGFAIAAHLQPEILIVDEVLAVGDAQFQKKCLGKMGDVAKSGRTVLFVSHNTIAIKALCSTVVLMVCGTLHDFGTADSVVSQYLAHFQAASSTLRNEHELSNSMIAIRNARVATQEVCEGHITTKTPVDIEIECDILSNSPLSLTLLFYTDEGIVAFGSSLTESPGSPDFIERGHHKCVCRIPGCLMNSGRIRVALLAVDQTPSIVFQHDSLLTFEVFDIANDRCGWYGRKAGVVRPALHWQVD